MRGLPAAIAAMVAMLTPAPVAALAPPVAHVVVLHDGAGDPARVAAEHAAAFGFDVGHLYRAALPGYAAELTPGAVAALRADGRVAAVEIDRPVTLTAPAVPLGVDRIDADLSVTAAIDDADEPRVDADVAVLDTGIDEDHPDLNVAGGRNCANDEGYDDRLGHGTHIAGIIGALDDGKGVVGAAPGVRLWAVRVVDHDGQGTTRQLLCGIDWVTGTRTDDDPDNDIEVVNLSLTGEGYDDGDCGRDGDPPDLLHQAICRSVEAGVTYVVAAGNNSADVADYSPAAYREVITVSALADTDGRPGGLGGKPSCQEDGDDTFANFSNYGPDVDLIAPGLCILSTLPTNSGASEVAGYGVLTGTSFAAPHVSGAAALWLSGHPGADPEDVRLALIEAGSDDWNDGDDPDGIKEPLVNVEQF